MARHAEGWKLVWRRGIAHVRFRHEGKRLEYSCRTSDPGEARTTGARIYAEVVTRQRVTRDLASRAELLDLAPLWILALDGMLSPGTIREYEIYISAEWLPRWKTLGEITTAELGLYQRARLREVTRTTLDKERSAMRGFLEWCVEQEKLRVAPDFPPLPKRSRGTRARPKREHIPLTDREVKKLLAALPSYSKPHPFQPTVPFIVRDFFALLWETGLRASTIERLSAPEHYKRGSDRIVLFDDADKARHDRAIPLTTKARAILDRHAREGVIFGAHSWREYLRPASERALGRRVAVDDFRHSRITGWLEEGLPLPAVGHAVGHKHLSTTARYVHTGFDATLRAFKARKRA